MNLDVGLMGCNVIIVKTGELQRQVALFIVATNEKEKEQEEEVEEEEKDEREQID